MDSGPVGSMLMQLLFILMLILANGFFASAEIAIFSINKNKIKYLSNSGDERAKYLLDMIDEPSKFLTTIQVIITIFGFLVVAIVTKTMSQSFDVLLESINMPYGSIFLAIFIAFVLCYLTLVFGIMIPKKMALKNPEKVAMKSAKIINISFKLMKPFINLISCSTNALIGLLGLKEVSYTNVQDKISKEEIKSLVNTSKEQGTLNAYEKDMIESIIEFDNKIAKEVMTPRTEVFAINVNSSIREISSKLLHENFSRVPVYEKHIDNIIGILYMKDFFYEANKIGIDNMDIRKIIRKSYFVPETKQIDTLFDELKECKKHMAVILDEYGGFSGIVTIEDLIEEVMGDIFDEYDEMSEDIKKIDDKTYLVDGLLSINALNEKLNVNIKTECFETIGGFVVSLMGNIPKNDDSKKIQYNDIVFEVEEISSKRIEKIKLCLES